MLTLLVSLRLAWKALMLNKLRSALTLLGLVIGVGAVIAIVSLGEGLRAQFENEVESMGTGVMYMFPKVPKRPGQARGYNKPFANEDLEAIRNNCETIANVHGGLTIGAMIKYENEITTGQAIGTSANYLEIFSSYEMDRGRYFNQAEWEARARVAVVGDSLCDDLFKRGQDPVGQRVRINGHTFTVVGKLKKYSGFSGGPDVNTGFLIPLSTLQERLANMRKVFFVALFLKPDIEIDAAKEDVSRVMRQRRRVRNVTDDDFQFFTPEDFQNIANTFINVLVGIFGAIAFISLLVGGVGIMNIMLVSVTERTREIGLRMAIGATKGVVLIQFLVEAIMLTILGGFVGMGFGYGGAWAFAEVLKKTLEASWAPHIPLNWALYSVGASALVGLIFGVYPAWKASRLDPVEAMRYE